MSPALIAVLATVAVLAVLIVLARARRGQVRVARVLDAHGAGRCAQAVELLERLEAEGSPAIAAAWPRIEMPLLQALPDCPPDLKMRLALALESCAKACRVVETSRALMTMRNAVLR